MIWLFDLDNTLHDASHAIFQKITANMNNYIVKVIGDSRTPVSLEAANDMRLLYWKRYGATMLGMVRHYGISPSEFLHAAHQFDDLSAMLIAERGLTRLLQKLPGKKILLTNSAYRYSNDVLKYLGLHRCFAHNVAIESMHVHGQLTPKPSKKLLRKILTREKVLAKDCILVEDNEITLKAAKMIGMRTVLVSQYSKGKHQAGLSSPGLKRRELKNRAAYIDVKIQSIRQLPDYLYRLR